MFPQFAPASTPTALCFEISQRLEKAASSPSLDGSIENEDQSGMVALAAKMRALGGNASEALELYARVGFSPCSKSLLVMSYRRVCRTCLNLPFVTFRARKAALMSFLNRQQVTIF